MLAGEKETRLVDFDNNLALNMPSDEAFGQIITCEIDGFLEASDLAVLAGAVTQVGDEPSDTSSENSAIQPPPAPKPENPGDLKKIREKHHSVARLVASGLAQKLVAELSGYTESYLSVLLNNPSMEELVTFYRAANGNAAQVITENLRTVGAKALEKLSTQIDNDKLNAQDLIAAAKLGFDRSGHGPKTTHAVEQTTHIVDHAAIAELNRKALAESRENIVSVDHVRRQLEHTITDAVFEDVAEEEETSPTDETPETQEQGGDQAHARG